MQRMTEPRIAFPEWNTESLIAIFHHLASLNNSIKRGSFLRSFLGESAETKLLKKLADDLSSFIEKFQASTLSEQDKIAELFKIYRQTASVMKSVDTKGFLNMRPGGSSLPLLSLLPDDFSVSQVSDLPKFVPRDFLSLRQFMYSPFLKELGNKWSGIQARITAIKVTQQQTQSALWKLSSSLLDSITSLLESADVLKFARTCKKGEIPLRLYPKHFFCSVQNGSFLVTRNEDAKIAQTAEPAESVCRESKRAAGGNKVDTTPIPQDRSLGDLYFESENGRKHLSDFCVLSSIRVEDKEIYFVELDFTKKGLRGGALIKLSVYDIATQELKSRSLEAVPSKMTPLKKQRLLLVFNEFDFFKITIFNAATNVKTLVWSVEDTDRFVSTDQNYRRFQIGPLSPDERYMTIIDKRLSNDSKTGIYLLDLKTFMTRMIYCSPATRIQWMKGNILKATDLNHKDYYFNVSSLSDAGFMRTAVSRGMHQFAHHPTDAKGSDVVQTHTPTYTSSIS
jgi:hypothetical protein